VHYVVEAFALLCVVALLMLFARRARVRSADTDARLRRDIAVGTQVMTTSGLYGTVVAINPDDTVILSVAPGVDVRWAFAALRDAAALPLRYRRPVDGPVAAADSPGDVRGERL
jgi:preprotein translocase subunit YajC